MLENEKIWILQNILSNVEGHNSAKLLRESLFKVIDGLAPLITASGAGVYTGIITPASTVPVEGDKVFLVTIPGTYTNFGNVVLPENNFGFIFKNENSFSIQSVEMPTIPINGIVEESNVNAVSGGEVYKSVKVGLDTITNLLNVFNTDDIELYALDSGNKITSNVNGRTLVVQCKEGDKFSFKRNSTTQNNRLTIGYSSVLPAPGVVLNNVVDHATNLEFTSTAPDGAKYFIIYLSLDTVEPNYDGYFLYKNEVPVNLSGLVASGDSRGVTGDEVYKSVKVGLNTVTDLLNVFNTDDIELYALNANNRIDSNVNGRILVVPCKEGDEFEFYRNSTTQTNKLTIGYSSVLPAPGVVLNNAVNHATQLEFKSTAPVGAKYFILYLSLDTVEPNYDGYFLYKNEVPVNLSGLVASGDSRGVTGDEVYKSVKVGLNAVSDLLNIFNTGSIQLYALSADNKITTNANGRLFVTPTVEGDQFSFSRNSTTQNNRLTIGYTNTMPSSGVQLNNVVNHATQLEFKSTAPEGAKYFVIYLSLDANEPDYDGIFLGKKGVASDSDTEDSGLRTDIGIYDPQFSENIFSSDILVNAYVSQSNRVTESANYRSILLNNIKRGERFLIDLTGSGSNKSVIATSITTDEVDENKLMDGKYTPTTMPFVFEVTGFTKQAYIYISENATTLDTSKIVVKKLQSKNIEIIDRRTINGILKYYEAEISEDVSPASATLNLRTSNVNDIYARFDALMTANPDIITKRLLGYGSSETDPEVPVNAEDTNLPIYEYTFSWLKENMNENSFNVQGLRLQKRPKIFVSCGLHGDEKSTTWAMYLLFKKMIEEVNKENLLYDFKNQLEFVVIPVANPWGFNFDQRNMANGADLNRSFPLSVKGDDTYNKYPEIRAVLNSLDANEDSYAFIDYHCLEKGTRPYSGYINTENKLSREAFSQLAYEMNDRIIDIYELPDSDVLQFFYSTTKGDLFEKYVMLTTPIRYTAIIECLENFGGVYYSQKVIRAAEEIIVNYIRSIFLR